MSVTLVITIIAVLIMLYALWMIFSIKKHIPGGLVGRHWRNLAGLILLFAVGYIALPLVGRLSAETLHLVVAVIFLLGAIYVVLTVFLIKKMILVLNQ